VDEAFFDRFCHVTLSSGKMLTHAWQTWMKQQFGQSAADVISFCSASSDHLLSTVKPELPFKVKPTPRSWEAVTRGLEVIKQGVFSDATKRAYVAGWVGRELATSFLNYRPTLNAKTLLDAGVEASRDCLDQCSRAELNLIISDFANSRPASIKRASYHRVAADLIEYLCKKNLDLAIACTTSILEADKDLAGLKMKTSLVTNERLARRVDRLKTDHSLLTELLSRDSLRHELITALGHEPN